MNVYIARYGKANLSLTFMEMYGRSVLKTWAVCATSPIGKEFKTWSLQWWLVHRIYELDKLIFKQNYKFVWVKRNSSSFLCM